MDRGQVVRCPRCGCRADASVAVVLHLTPEAARTLARYADAVRRELRLPTNAEAIVAATARQAVGLVLD